MLLEPAISHNYNFMTFPSYVLITLFVKSKLTVALYQNNIYVIFIKINVLGLIVKLVETISNLKVEHVFKWKLLRVYTFLKY